MLAHLALAIAPIITPTAMPTPHTFTAMAPVEVWARGLGDLRGIAVSPDGRVWVTDHAGGRLLRLDAAGAVRVVATGLRGPIGVALDQSGRVLVAERDAGRIVAVSPLGTTVVATGLEQPRWLAVGEDDTIHVSARKAGESVEGDAPRTGVVLASRGGAPVVLLHGLRDPEGLAIHDGILYVATRDPILRVPLAGDDDRLDEYADGTLKKPMGLAIDVAGAVYVTAHRLALSEEHVAGVVVRLHGGATPDLFAAGADEPQGLAFDRDGHLYLADSKCGCVVRFVAPRAPAIDATPEWTRAPNVTLSGQADADARVEVVAADGTTHGFAGSTGTFALTVPLVHNVVNRFDVRAIGHDGAGLVSPVVAVTIVHDTVPPTVALDSPPTGALVRGTVAIRARAADVGSQLAMLELLASGQLLATAVTPSLPASTAAASAAWDSTTRPDGVFTLAARAVDRAGNVTTVTRTITVDNTPPEVEIAGPETTSDGVRFTFTGRDNLTPSGDLEFAWRIDDGDWSGFLPATSATLTNPRPGSHRLEAKSRDRAGNESVRPTVLAFTVAGGPLGIAILEPLPDAAVPAGTILVRGVVEAVAGDVGVTVNGLPAWIDGTTFTALAEIEPDSTSIVAVAVGDDGRRGQVAIPIRVAEAPAVSLLATPWSGVAPLTVRFSLPRDPQTARVELDVDGDGVLDFTGPALDEHVMTYARPGIYVARAVVTDDTGRATLTRAVVRVFDPAVLDGQLRAKWSAMRDALRRGDIAAGVGHIVARRRANYETAFRLLSASLPAIDTILTDLTPVRVRNGSAIYEMRRTDDGLPKSFEIRFAIDADGVWRLESF